MRQFKAIFVVIIFLALSTGAAVYFHFVPEEWAAVKGPFIPKPGPAEPGGGAGLAENQPKLKIGFDLHDIGKTSSWAVKFASALQKTAGATGNQLKVNEQLAEVQADFEALRGQTVRWELPVQSVADSFVVLDGQRDGLILFQAGSDGDAASYMSRLSSVTAGQHVVHLKIGDGISPAEAAKLQKGSKVVVTANVDEVSVRYKIANAFRNNDSSGYVLMVTVSEVRTQGGQGRSQQPAVLMTFQQLLDEWQNEIAAREKFEHQTVQVTGRIVGFRNGGFVLRDLNDPITDANSDSGAPARCNELFISQRRAKKIENNDLIGRVITVQGTSVGNVYNGGRVFVTLQKCSPVTTWAELVGQINKKRSQAKTTELAAAEGLEKEVREAVPQAPAWGLAGIVEAQGEVVRVFEHQGGIYDGILEVDLSCPDFQGVVACHFRAVHRLAVAGLKPGSIAKIRGKIEKRNSGQLDLVGCILMK